jgi:hypothetical protein
MMTNTVERIQDIDSIECLRDSWNRLRKTTDLNAMSLDQYIDAVSSDADVLSPLVIVARDAEMVIAIIPLAVFNRPKKFVIGELRLFTINHRVLHIVGGMIGSLEPEQAGLLIQDLAEGNGYDSVNLYEIPTDDGIYITLQAKDISIKTSSSVFDVFPHWVVEFPESFDVYMSGFKSKTRNTLKRKFNQLQKSHQVRFEKITDCREVEKFLETGEAISRQTYQWDLGTRLINNERTLRSFEIAARQKEMVCYLLYADDVAIAFTWGYLINNVFHYETPGFLREYSRWSPGIIILMKIFEDLIENAQCRRFDFGMGGDYTGYKSQFGNSYFEAAVVEFYPCKTFKSWRLYLLDRLFWQLKRILRRLISPQLKSRVKQILRKLSIVK